MQEDDTVQLYYSTENTREFKEVEEQNLEVGAAQLYTKYALKLNICLRWALSWHLQLST